MSARRSLTRGLLDGASRLWSVLPLPVRRFIRDRYPPPRFRAGVLAVILDDAGRVLLLEHRFRSNLPWGLPGGWLEPGEDPADGMCRELHEELGLDLGHDALDLLATTSRDGRPHIEIFYRVSAVVGAIADNPEFSGHGWFALDDLPSGMFGPHRDFIESLGG